MASGSVTVTPFNPPSFASGATPSSAKNTTPSADVLAALSALIQPGSAPQSPALPPTTTTNSITGASLTAINNDAPVTPSLASTNTTPQPTAIAAPSPSPTLSSDNTIQTEAPAAAVQGNIVQQASAYSSVASSSSSTIRGAGINVLS